MIGTRVASGTRSLCDNVGGIYLSQLVQQSIAVVVDLEYISSDTRLFDANQTL